MDIKYIATIHTPRGSYRMVTGCNGWMQNEISRMFEVASTCHIPSEMFEDILNMLATEDDICEVLGYHRYDGIEPVAFPTMEKRTHP